METIKKRNLKKIGVVIAAIVMMFSLSLTSVYATDLTVSNGTRGFNSKWEARKTSGNAELIYGFNTKLIDEDYAWAKHATRAHYASIYQAYTGKWSTSHSVVGGKTVKFEIRHRGSTIKYRCSW